MRTSRTVVHRLREPGSVRARRIKEDAEYEGVRVSVDGKLGSAKLAVQVDVGRMKDFFNLWFLCREFEFEGQTLVDAIRSTFGRRQTAIRGEAPVGLTDTFALDATKQTQWSAFLDRSRVVEKTVTLPAVVTTCSPEPHGISGRGPPATIRS